MKISERDLVRSLCRGSYKDFFREFWGTVTRTPLEWNWHLDVLCDEMQELAERVFRREPRDHDTVFNVPPGTSKSSGTSILFPPWVWTRMPEAQFICGSYSDPLALELSNKCRDVVKSDKYRVVFPEVVLRSDQDTKSFFKNTAGGYRYALGAGGSCTGFHGHFILIDDPIDPKQARSDAVIASANHWIKHELRQRKTDKLRTVTVLIMQRLHQDDPSAQKLREKRVRHFRIPAELSYKVHPPELERHYVDGLMDPNRMPRDYLEEERSPTGLGEYGYAGQYGQDPVPAGGGMFKTSQIRRGRAPADWAARVRFWDKAATSGGGAFTAGVLGGLDRDGRVWILDVVRRQVDPFVRERTILATARRDGHEVRIGQELEGGSGGKDSAEGTVRRLRGYRVQSLPSRGDKAVRADEFASQVNGGNVWMPEHMWEGDPATGAWTGWAADYVEELRHFPHSTFMDQVDASSGMLKILVRPKKRVGGVLSRRQRTVRQTGHAVHEVEDREVTVPVLPPGPRVPKLRRRVTAG
jgi:predicted phage terminase large subunit-like protein